MSTPEYGKNSSKMCKTSAICFTTETGEVTFKLVRSIVETSEQLNLEDKVILLANFIKL